MRRLVRLLGAFLTGLLVVAAPASAGTFGAPQLVTNEGFAPQAAIGADGTTALAWIATTPGGRSHRGLAFATRGPDGSAGPTQELATSSGATRVAVADDGTATVAWVVGGVLRAASAAPGAMLGTAQVLASGVNERDFALAAGPAETIVTWSAGGAVRMAVRRGPEGFGPAEDGFGVPIAMDAAGTAFSARRGAGGRSLEMARRPTGGSFGAPQVVGAGLPGSDRAGYAVTLDALDAYRDGSVGLMATAWEDAYTETRWVAAAGPGEALREPVRLDRASTGSGPPMVTGRYAGRTTAFGVGPAGAVLTATERMNWSRSQSDALQVQLVGADGVARQPELVPGLTGAHGPRVAFDASGAGVIVTSSPQRTVSATLPRGSERLCAPSLVADQHTMLAPAAFDSGPTGVLAWQETGSSNVSLVFHQPVEGCPVPVPIDQAPTVPTPPWQRPDLSSPPPAPTVVPPAAPQIPTAVAPRPAVAARAAVDSRLRRAAVRLTCPAAAGRTCRGRIELLGAALRPKGRAAAARPGRATFAVPAGATRTVRVTLTAAVRRSLKRKRSARIRARIVATGATPRVVTLTLRR